LIEYLNLSMGLSILKSNLDNYEELVELVKSTILVWDAITKHQPQMWFINNRKLFLTVLEAGKSKVKARQIQCLLRAHLLSHR
jgi:hypothetical protein